MKTDEESSYPADCKGVPEFWLSVLKSARATEGLIEPHDEEILKHLTNISCEVLPSCKNDDGVDIASYRLDFHFSKNDYFDQTVLSKTYLLRARPNEEFVLAYEGPEIESFETTKIEWKSKNLDPCTKVIKKKQTNKKTGNTRVVEKSETQDSFFSFFQPIDDRKFLTEEDDDDEEIDQEQSIARSSNSSISDFIKKFKKVFEFLVFLKLIMKLVTLFVNDSSLEQYFILLEKSKTMKMKIISAFLNK